MTKTTKKTISFPIRYLPKNISIKDKKRQIQMLLQSKKMYKENKYYTRKNIHSFTSKKSNHIKNAQKIYKINKIIPNKDLSVATGCSIQTLKQIVKKGEGAYYSSGSRPNQTAQSWGLARLASSITGGKSSAIDYHIVENGCNHRKKAFLLARKSKKIYGNGRRKTYKTKV